MDSDRSWLADKDRLLEELNVYITRCSLKEPPPMDYIWKLMEVRTLIEISTEEELQEFLVWWEKVKPED